MGATGGIHLGRGSQRDRRRGRRLRKLRESAIDGALSAILRFDLPLDTFLRWSDSDSSLSYHVINRASQHPSWRLRDRLATHTVLYGLVKLSEKLNEIRSSTSEPEWQHFTGKMAPLLLKLEESKYSLQVLYYGNEIFSGFRDFAHVDTEQVLGKTLFWHKRFFDPSLVGRIGFYERSGIEREGARAESTGRIEVDNSVLRVAQLSGKIRISIEGLGANLGGQSGATGSLLEPSDVASGPQTLVGPSGGPPEPPRYTDLSIYQGKQYKGDSLAAAVRLSDDMPLVAGRDYTLEVAIRMKRRGIGADKDPTRAVKNPRRDKEHLTVYVLATSVGGGSDPVAEISEPFAKITWPYDSDSDSALFRFKTTLTRGAETSKGTIQVRVYDKSLDLLDVVTAHFTIVDSAAIATSTRGVISQQVIWPSEGTGDLSIDPKSPERALSIHVCGEQNAYGFEFLFRNVSSDEVIRVPILRNISTQDLVNLLAKVRDFWTDLVIVNYAEDLSVTQTMFVKSLNRLAELGREAWGLLFGGKTGGKAGASEALGDLLKSMELGEGTIVQITYDETSKNFVFPWSILYPLSEGSETVDPFRFWGARYQIEQTTDGPRDDSLTSEPIKVLFALDESFGDSALQKELFKKLKTPHGGLEVTDPISDERTLFAELDRDPSAHLLYFFCHGYASGNPGPLRLDGARQLADIIEKLPEESPGRKAFEKFSALLKHAGGESWIYIGDSEIKESELRGEFFVNRRPIVFLNACQSADLLPSMSTGLVRVFLDHNACAVLGTESPMTSVFANAFAKDVLDALFEGDNIGTALLKARRRFLGPEMRNPLGLAYTLYGRSTARLGGETTAPTPVG
jgi:hypothetical protein